jgi:prepilin-type N-terminal cleavage/methylation domain-containing protein
MRPRPSFHRPLRLPAEDGFTLIELLAAVLVLTVGLLGLIGAFDSARKLNLLSERRTSMAHRAQLEIERLQALKYSELAMKEKPSHSTEEANPDYYVKEGGEKYQYGTEATEVENLMTGGVIEPSPSGHKCSEKIGACEWEDGLVKGYVYDFVTWHADQACTKKTENYKRLTVVVTAKVPSGNHQPAAVRVSTLIANPTESKEELKSSC